MLKNIGLFLEICLISFSLLITVPFIGQQSDAYILGWPHVVVGLFLVITPFIFGLITKCRAGSAATLSGLYNCNVCGEEKCIDPGICDDCLAPPTEFELNEKV